MHSFKTVLEFAQSPWSTLRKIAESYSLVGGLLNMSRPAKYRRSFHLCVSRAQKRNRSDGIDSLLPVGLVARRQAIPHVAAGEENGFALFVDTQEGSKDDTSYHESATEPPRDQGFLGCRTFFDGASLDRGRQDLESPTPRTAYERRPVPAQRPCLSAP